jgi:hypothetical protein
LVAAETATRDATRATRDVIWVFMGVSALCTPLIGWQAVRAWPRLNDNSLHF